MAVLPGEGPEAAAKKRRLLTHLRYWDYRYAQAQKGGIPYHITVLREALDLNCTS